MSNIAELQNRLVRIETKMIRGFEELGVDTDVDPDWISVENRSQTIIITTLARSLKVLIREAKRRGAAIGEREYAIVFHGKEVAWI